LIESFGTPFETELPLSFQVTLPKCFTKAAIEMKADLLEKLPDKSLIYIFYNYENRAVQHKAVKLLYQKDWVYNFDELLWFYDLNMNDMSNAQFFNIKKWELMPYHLPLKKEYFAKLEDFETYAEIKEGNSGNVSI
jgi:CCR4-NOT transcriptional regulation complex NOT5 subunit